MPNHKWEAEWIWEKGHGQQKNSYCYFKKSFIIPDRIKSGRIWVSADSRYKLHVNEFYVGRGPAPCDPRFWQDYDIWDITKFLKTGKNYIYALVHYYGEKNHLGVPNRGGFILQAVVQDKKNNEVVVKTDSTWQVRQSRAWEKNAPVITEQLGFQEIYNAANTTGRWENASSLGRPPVKYWPLMRERDIPYLEEQQVFPENIIETGEITAKNISYKKIAENIMQEPHQKNSGDHICNAGAVLKNNDLYALVKPVKNRDLYIIIDFGKEIVGYPRIILEGGKGTILDIGYSEILLENNILNTYSEKRRIKYADRYILKDGIQTWESSFNRKGFRYLQITVRNQKKPLKLFSVSCLTLKYPVRKNGSFRCSDELLNRIWSIGKYTLQLCMLDAYIDCPWREQGQYSGDASVQMAVNYYLFGDALLARRCLRQLILSQRPDGMINSRYPSGHEDILSDFCLLWISALQNYFIFTGDKALLGELFPKIKIMVKGFKKYLSEENLLTDVPFRTFIDWADMDDDGKIIYYKRAGWKESGQIAALNCFFYKALIDASEIASVLGRENEKIEYAEIAMKIKKAINDYFWDEQKRVYKNFRKTEVKRESIISQQTNFLAILYGIAEKKKRKRILSYILDDNNKVIKAQPYFLYYGLQVMSLCRKYDTALNLIRHYWGSMIKAGATSFWEKLYGMDPTRSRCHAWATAGNYYMASEILGIKPLAPGLGEILIEPKITGLEWAEGAIPGPHGKIQVKWINKKSRFFLELIIPPGSTACLKFPAAMRSASINIISVCKKNKTLKKNNSINCTGDKSISLSAGKYKIKCFKKNL